MIPASMGAIWEKSLDSGDVHLKICGAGGGGFMLGFARNRAAALELSENHPVIFPFDQSATHG
jgi:mevalonate kinase